jgi:hypothetical protein
VRRLTLLSGPAWPLPSGSRLWLASEPAYVAVEVLDPASARARALGPNAAPAAGIPDLVAIADDGRVWRGPRSWIVALWALRRHRALALDLARRGDFVTARRFLRERIRRSAGGRSWGRDAVCEGPTAGGAWTWLRRFVKITLCAVFALQAVFLLYTMPWLAALLIVLAALALRP